MPHPILDTEDHPDTVSLVAVLADYAAPATIIGDSAIEAARRCLVDALGRGFQALCDPECAALIGPLVPGALMPGGARVPGTSLELDPAQAAFCNGLLLCRPASDDYWQALGSGRAADPLGAILAVADYHARKAMMEGKSPPKLRSMLAAIAKALQIQGAVAFEAGYQEIGTATLRLVRVATAAIVAAQLGGTQGQIVTALSHACMDGGMSIHADKGYDIGRRAWATADAISRAVRHACQAMAAGRSSYLTSDHLKIMDVAGRFLGAKPTPARPRFGPGAMDSVSGLYRPHHVVESARDSERRSSATSPRVRQSASRHSSPRPSGSMTCRSTSCSLRW